MQLPTTIKECHELLEEQQKVITELKAMMVSMSLRIKDLENQLNQNSHYSHRPPSSDGYRKKPALGGNPKGKPGQSGNTLKMIDTVDHRQPIYPEQCSCGAPLKAEDMVLHTGRQVFDLPQPRLEVTDYQSFSCRCPQYDEQVIGRGSKAQESSESVLSSYMGTAVHDCLPVYLTNMISFHSICGAHLLRELTALKEQGSQWAELMPQLLMQLYEASDKGLGKVKHIKTWVSKYNQICKIADEEEPPHQQGPRGRVKQTKGRNLLGRLTKYRRYVLAFAEFDDIPFTNNQAERDLRNNKVRDKVLGEFQRLEPAQKFMRIRSLIGTAIKQAVCPLQTLEMVFTKGNSDNIKLINPD